jgi:hypothetical protein
MDELFQQARSALRHVYWIGGPGCSGKSSVARMLGHNCALRVYHVDDELADYAPDPSLRSAQWREVDFLGKEGKPLFDLPAQEVAAFVIHGWQTAIFAESIRRLLLLPRDQGIIVEGVFLPETLLRVADSDRIAVMTSCRTFHQHYFAHRHAWIEAYADQEQAFGTVLDALDEMDRQWIAQANQYEVALFTIQSLQEIRNVAATLATHFAT